MRIGQADRDGQFGFVILCGPHESVLFYTNMVKYHLNKTCEPGERISVTTKFSCDWTPL